MKFQLILDANSRTISLTPENDGERQILESMCSVKDGEAAMSASLRAEHSPDRPPYRKLTKLNIVVGND